MFFVLSRFDFLIMTNKEIANKFNLLGKLMELHGENQFKVRSYYSAYQGLRRLDMPVTDMDPEEWGTLQGVGKAIQGKIGELLDGGQMNTLNRYIEMTPPGVIDILSIKGLGPKKVKTIWQDMGVESPGELLYACNENRLIELKGFGEKTQADVIKQINFHLAAKGHFLYPTVETVAEELKQTINSLEPDALLAFTGEYGMKSPIVTTGLQMICSEDIEEILVEEFGEDLHYEDEGMSIHGIPLEIEYIEESEFIYESIMRSSSDTFASHCKKEIKKKEGFNDEKGLFEANKMPFIPAELRDYPYKSMSELGDIAGSLVQEDDIKGVIHTHTTYSDGLYSVKDMAEYSQSLGYEYLVITDHSKSAFYANGLSLERIATQHREIEELNKSLENFKVFKGIECDILYDGSMDYEDGDLASFDLVIASVHSQLKMDEAKATARLLKAIENPYVKMLGHMTGRLLLSREGYPVDHAAIIDTCAANGVLIELNANPHRLDMDYHWIQYATEKGVKIAINPDAHNKDGIHDIKYGVFAARKGGLSTENCINTLGLEEFEGWLCKEA